MSGRWFRLVPNLRALQVFATSFGSTDPAGPRILKVTESSISVGLPSQYTSEQFQRLLAEHDITCSMSRSGNVWDNSAMESFFLSLKIGRVHRGVYATHEEAKADLFDCSTTWSGSTIRVDGTRQLDI
jgi:transposase InsO family protein